MKYKEKNFISAIVYVRNQESTISVFLEMLYDVLITNYEKHEIICVNDSSTDKSVQRITEFANMKENAVVSIINMSYYQGLEISMNAGIDLSIGDFVYEFESANIDYKAEVIMQVYDQSLKGYDIVSASPNKIMKFSSRLFYRLFNKYSNNPNRLETESFRIISRRGINRVQAINKTMPYRKATYAGCGLKTSLIKYDCQKMIGESQKNDLRLNTAIDAFILFTDIGYKIALILTCIMMIATLLSGAYTIYVFFNAAPIAGWTTTMLVLSFSFFGLFIVLAIVIKYLSIIVSLIFNKQKYIIEGIEKLTK